MPIALDMVRFSLDGPAEWRGGIVQGDSSGKARNAAPAAAATVNIVTQRRLRPTASPPIPARRARTTIIGWRLRSYPLRITVDDTTV